MLQILQTRNMENYADKIAGLELAEKYPNVVEAIDNDKITGIGIYHMNFEENRIVIDYAEYGNDLVLLDGIIRSILYLAMLRNIDSARFDLPQIDDVRKLGFVQNCGNLLEPVSDFMSKCKSCGKSR